MNLHAHFSPQLKELDLRYYFTSELDGSGVGEVVAFMEENHVVKLMLPYCELVTTEAYYMIAAYLSSSSCHLESIDFQDIHFINDDWLVHLSHHLLSNHTLTHLSLRHCTIGKRGLLRLGQSVLLHPLLQALDLSYLRKMDHDAIDYQCFDFLKRSSLDTLELNGLDLGADDILKITQFLADGKVTHLSLKGNPMNTSSIKQLTQLHQTQYLNLSDVDVSEEDVAYLASLVEGNSTLLGLDLEGLNKLKVNIVEDQFTNTLKLNMSLIHFSPATERIKQYLDLNKQYQCSFKLSQSGRELRISELPSELQESSKEFLLIASSSLPKELSFLILRTILSVHSSKIVQKKWTFDELDEETEESEESEEESEEEESEEGVEEGDEEETDC